MSRLKPRPTKNNAEKKKGSRGLGCPFLIFYITEAVTHKACTWLCTLTIDTMRQNPSELTLRAELSG